MASHNGGAVFRLVDNGTAIPPTPTPTPAEIKFELESTSVPESPASLQLKVLRTGDPAPELQVLYSTGDGTASERKDYTTAQGTLRFAPGETTKTFDVLITNDETDEADETVALSLARVSGGLTFLTDTAQFVITDDDAATSADNPIDRSDFFVRQHTSTPQPRADDAGRTFWVNARDLRRGPGLPRGKRATLAAFFLSLISGDGYFVYLVHKAAFGTRPELPDVPRRHSADQPRRRGRRRRLGGAVCRGTSSPSSTSSSRAPTSSTASRRADARAVRQHSPRTENVALTPAERDELARG